VNINSSEDITRRMQLATGAHGAFKVTWKEKGRPIQLETKMQLLKTCVFSVLLYAAETFMLQSTTQ